MIAFDLIDAVIGVGLLGVLVCIAVLLWLTKPFSPEDPYKREWRLTWSGCHEFLKEENK